MRKLYGVLMWLMPRNMGFLVVVQVEQQVVVQVEQQFVVQVEQQVVVQVEQQVVVVQVEQQLFTTCTSSVQVEQQVVQVVGKLYLAGASVGKLSQLLRLLRGQSVGAALVLARLCLGNRYALSLAFTD